MGIPKFFKWLTRRYPMILQNIQRDEDCPPTDNLYLDLNSIVHNCIHGNDSKRHERISKLTDFEEVWADIMRAIDEIVHAVKPRKLILLAVDGVAPRAKMNQQRARRFRSAKDSAELREQLVRQGKEVVDLFDSNQISPGTKFMYELGKQLEWFVKFKLNTDPLYQNCEKVVLSDSSVPGEGEHKMMDYIRNLKLAQGYNPNTRHCFYGSDADLIMLSLLTHEPHFMIIREEHVIRKVKQGGVQRIDISRTNNLQLIHISLLREYFLLEYRDLAPQMRPPMRFDLERIIDDFVFFCFFIGNDFLPSLSALDIGEGSLDHLINFYKRCLPQMKDYITHEGQIFWDRAEPFIELLGKHEHQVFINRVKTIDQQYHDSKNLMTFDENFSSQVGKMNKQDKAAIIQQALQRKIKEKKVEKCKKLFMNNQQKKHKKRILLKKFDEDYEESQKNEGDGFVKYQSLKSKYRKLRETQYQKDNQLISSEQKEENQSLHNIISELREEYLSDLNPEDIPNSDVSDIDESELVTEQSDVITAMEADRDMQDKVQVTKLQTDQYIEKNHQFMTNFVNTYKNDANEAKRSYYLDKLQFDVKEAGGKKELHKLLFRYLEGMQWVLFYYYKGAQHWRWYYPYHYAPMISDLGTNIVNDFLNGENTINEFRTGENCSENPKPYTPFQQLLCILPVKSLKQFLPPQYLGLAQGRLAEYFPAHFHIDLNGRTLPWEAAILIPFANEEEFIQAEKELFDADLRLTEEEWVRNTTNFVYPSYFFDKDAFKNRKKAGTPSRPLKPTLGSMDALEDDFATQQLHHDYEKVGQFGFGSKLLPGVQAPCPDFPSLTYLGVNSIDYTEKCVNKVMFKQCLARVPQSAEDASGAAFENWIYRFAQSQQQELFVKFPFQIEAFPVSFEDPYSVYKMDSDQNTGQIKVVKHRQHKSQSEFDAFCKSTRARLEYEGVQVGTDFNTLVTVSTLEGIEYDDVHDCTYKIYNEHTMTVPFNLCMKKRKSANHYLNMNDRVNVKMGRVKKDKPAILFNKGLFGVIGTVKGKQPRNDLVQIEIDQELEERKIHNPFLAENFLRRELNLNDTSNRANRQNQQQANAQRNQQATIQSAANNADSKESSEQLREIGSSNQNVNAPQQQEALEEDKVAHNDDKEDDNDGTEQNMEQPKSSLQETEPSSEKRPQQNIKRFLGDREIEAYLGIEGGLVNKLTGSFLLAFDEAGKEDRQIVDLGLNIKNFTKKVHIPDFVRFVAPDGGGSGTIYDEFEHNQLQRGARHIRKHWEYSQECFEIIKEYLDRFPEVFEAMSRTSRMKKAMHSLHDVYPDLGRKEKDQAIENVKKITGWIESLPVSKLPYVEMGFDALDVDLIARLQGHNAYVMGNYDTVNLRTKQTELVGVSNVYQENFPFWFPPYLDQYNRTSDFRVGNRVMNLNSSQRQYLPFGLRGTVVGKTDSKIIVMFDEQFLHGNNIYGHCQNYRGAQVEPKFILNLTVNFAFMVRNDRFIVKKFQEKPLQGCAAFEDDQDKEANQESGKQSKRQQHIGDKFSKQSEAEAKELAPATGMSKAYSQPEQIPKKGAAFNPNAKEFQPINLPKRVYQPKEEAKKREKPSPRQPKKQKKQAQDEPREDKIDSSANQEEQPNVLGSSLQEQQEDGKLDEIQEQTKQEEHQEEQIQPKQEETKSNLTAPNKPLFQPLPAFKLADPALMQQPEFQKIVQMSQNDQNDQENEDSKNDGDNKNQGDEKN